MPDALSRKPPGATARVAEAYGKLPLRFEANRGQTDSRVRFLARGEGYNLFLTPREAVFRLRIADCGMTKHRTRLRRPDARHAAKLIRNPQSSVLRMSLVNSKRNPKISGEGESESKSQYYSGADRRRWVRDVPSYARVRYEQVYKGVDVVYYGKQRELEYDFIVAPGADPLSITLAFEGADKLTLDAAGDLVLQMGNRRLTHTAPVVYQEVGGVRRLIEGSFVLKGERRVGFRVGEYDPQLPLVIDPVARIGFSTFHGGTGDDNVQGVAVDSAGNAVVVGDTDSVDYPAGGDDPDPNGVFSGFDAFVTKFNAAGTGTIYSVYLGGKDGDFAHAVAVDPQGNAYVTGVTDTDDGTFPVKSPSGPFQSAHAGRDDVFVAKFNPFEKGEASLVYSTLVGGGGKDAGRGIRLDAARNTTSVNDFPLKNAFQQTIGGGVANSDAFVAKLAPDARKALYSSYLGGKESDVGFALDVDARGNAYVAGDAVSDDFPVTEGFVQPERAESGDAFLTKINELNPDTVGVFNPPALQFQLRNVNAAGAPDITVNFGEAGDLPVAGDWDGEP